jgi:Tol biopolymer transport system component
MPPRLQCVKSIVLLGLCIAALGPGARTAEAQYFGRNKVQYESFKFQVLHTDHFDLYFYPEEEQAAEQAARIAERWYARYARFFGHELSNRQPLLLYASSAAFQQTNAISGELGEGTGGVTEAIKRRIVLPLGSSLAESDHVIGHELVHAFQYDITGGNGRGPGGMPAATQMPLWFIEGMAEYLSLGPEDPNTAMWMRDAALRNKLPSYRQLDDANYFPYRYGQALLAYISGRWGDQTIVRLLRGAGRNGDVSIAIQRDLGISGDSLVKAWHADLAAAYEPLKAKAVTPDQYGRKLIAGKSQATGLNVGPVVSPDGSRIVFYSARDLFSIEMYLFDANTGQLVRRVTKTAADPHFQSLEFINSAGSFDNTGQNFVFSSLVDGRPALDLIDVENGALKREIHFTELGEILHPAWSPDGRYVAFAAQSGGLTDLYLYDLQTDSLRRLTKDAYADLEPAWSPDGTKLAFVTDRFSTDTTNLRPGNYRLALMDVASGRITPLPSFDGAKNINPVWSPDGASIYFLADRGGITNIYRLNVASGAQTQVTNLVTGVSGITSLSPALSIARQTGRLVYSIYQEGNYAVYDADSAQVLAGTPLISPVTPDPALLPPQNRQLGELERLRADATIGEDAAATQTVSTYHPRLALDYVAQPYLAVGASSYGTFIGGGVTLYWSDMLGDQNLATMLQVSGSLSNLAALVAYQNTKSRLNWGVAVEQIPYITGGYLPTSSSADGDTLYQQIEIVRQTNREADAFFSYPFSPVARVEWSAGIRNISYAIQVESLVVVNPGYLLSDNLANVPAPPSLTMGTASAALVYDNSFYGAASPVLGERWRLEVDPVVGDLQFVNVLADYRRYFMPVRPFTLAVRLLHYGRYGPSADDQRIYPNFLGYQSMVRGYDYNSVLTDCQNAGGAGPACDVYTALFGSRIAVGNIELRFPLLGVLGLGHGYYGAFPIETAFFADGGVAWSSGQKPSFLGGNMRPLTSVGIANRLNLFGYVVIEVDYVRPFQRQGVGWTWQFGFTEGF